MRRIKVLNLAAPDSSDFLRAGELRPDKGVGVQGLRCKITAGLKNTNAAASALVDGDKQAFLDSFRCNLRYSKDQARKPYKDLSLKTLRQLVREFVGAELYDYSDATNGLAKALAANATTTVSVHMLIPTCQLWMVPELENQFAMGRSQCATVELELKWISGVALVTAGLSIDTTVPITVEIYPEAVPMKTDRWSWLPEYEESNIRDFRTTYSDRLPLLLIERTAPQATTAITKLNLKVGMVEIQRDASPLDFPAQRDAALARTNAPNIEDSVTRLYGLNPGQRLASVPAGELFVEQPNNDLANMQLGIFAVPAVGQSEVFTAVKEIADVLRAKSVKAVNALTLAGVEVPEHLSAYQPFSIFDAQDPEFERFPGVGCDRGGQPLVVLPSSGAGRARAAVATHKAHGETLAATDAAKQVARYVPGAAEGSRGFIGSVAAGIASAVGA